MLGSPFPRLEDIVVDRAHEASHKQEGPGPEVLIDFEDSTTTEKFATSALSWSQEKNKIHTTDGDESTEDGETVTPTSTIMSEKPGY